LGDSIKNASNQDKSLLHRGIRWEALNILPPR